MAEDFGAVPRGVFDDVDHLPLCDLGVFLMLMVEANDHGLLEGRASALARRFARSIDEIKEPLHRLEHEHKVIATYEVELDGGGRIRVCEILRYHSFLGHADTKANPSRRRKSDFPLRDGTYPTFRGHGSAERSGPSPKSPKAGAAEPARKSRGTSAEPPRNPRGSGAEPARKSRGSLAEPPRNAAAGRGEERRGEEISSLRSEDGATSAPSHPSPSGSTDARAFERPEEVSPPPALGGAGGDTETEFWDEPAAVPRVVEALCKRGHVYVDEARNGRCPKCDAGEPPPPPRSETRRGFVPPKAFTLPPQPARLA